jgi:hypothetical protein
VKKTTSLALFALLLSCLETLSATNRWPRTESHFGGRLVYQRDAASDTPPDTIAFPISCMTAFNVAGPQLVINGVTFLNGNTAPNFAWTGAAVTNGYTVYPPVSGTEATMLETSALNPSGGTFVVSGLAANTYVIYLWSVTDVGTQPFTATINGARVITNSFPSTLPGWIRMGPYSILQSTPGNMVITTGASAARLAGIEICEKRTNSAPIVKIIYPTDGYTAVGPATIVATATAEDQDGFVAAFSWVLDGATIANQFVAPWTTTMTALPAGTYTLSAMATDDMGTFGMAPAIGFTITEPANLPPAVTLTAPTNGALFTYVLTDPVQPVPITLEATATDSDGTVTKVDWYSSTLLIATDTTSPYTGLWPAVGGVYPIVAVATDDDGAMATSAVATITVTNTPVANIAPTVQITAPTNGVTFYAPASFSFTANASDSDGTISNVVFYRTSSVVGTDTTSPYASSMSSLLAGNYNLTAVAQDDDGAKATNFISINVIPPPPPPNIPPTVTVTSPPNGTTYLAPATVTFSATASDSDGTVTSVQFWQGGTLIYDDTLSPYTSLLSSLSANTYVLRAVATDDDGAKTTNSVTIVVGTPPNQAPLVTLTSPTNGATFNGPLSIPVAATASDPDGTITSVTFYRGASSLGVDTSVPYSLVNASVPVGTQLYSAVALDNSGARSTNQVTVYVVTPPVNIAPTVTITSPVNGDIFTAPVTNVVTATATDTDGTIVSVQFWRLNVSLGTDTTYPYSVNSVITTANDWWYVAVATDDDGATATNMIQTKTVLTPNSPPTVYIAQPTSGATFTYPSTVPCVIGAADPDGTISSVLVRTNGTQAAVLTVPPYTTSLANLGSGTWSLSATATDNLGLTATTNLSFVIQPPIQPNLPPLITITAPTNNTTFTYPGAFPFNATVTDSDGTVTNVLFLRDVTQLASFTAGPYTYSVTSLGSGTYSMRVIATDDDSAKSTNSVTVIVGPVPNIPPTVYFTSPTNGATFTL